MLLTTAIWQLVDRGLNPVLVWVLTQNPARHFYESLGAVPCIQRPVDLGGGVFGIKTGYGWHEALPLPPLGIVKTRPACAFLLPHTVPVRTRSTMNSPATANSLLP